MNIPTDVCRYRISGQSLETDWLRQTLEVANDWIFQSGTPSIPEYLFHRSSFARRISLNGKYE
jgi:hypothetical protein